jgi:hypothetical protein
MSQRLTARLSPPELWLNESLCRIEFPGAVSRDDAVDGTWEDGVEVIA